MHRTFSKFAIVGAAFAVIVGINVSITGQPASELSVQPASPHPVGVPDDWSHHHLVFSNPGTYEQAAKDPAALAKWLRIHSDTRFILQQMKRHAADAVSPSGMVEPEDLAIGGLRQLPGEAMARLRPKPKPKNPTHPTGLWSEALLTGTVQPNAYPAKWGASLTSASCSDYVVYPTGTAGSGTTASIVAYHNLYSVCLGMGSPPSTYWAYNTGGGTVYGTLSPSSPNVTLSYGTFTSADVGAQISGTGITSPDTISSVRGPTMADLATPPSTEPGETLNIQGATVSTSPIISLDGSQVAFIQSQGAPASLVLLKWYESTTTHNVTGTVTTFSYNGSNYGWLALSEGIFLDADVGAQITDSGGFLPAGDTIITLHDPTTAELLYPPSDGTTPSEMLTITPEAVTTPGVFPPSPTPNYYSASAPEMAILPLAGATTTPNDTFSAPFYEYLEYDSNDARYEGDALYVGDDSGYLHMFTPVFNGPPTSSPAEVVTCGTAPCWPVKVSTAGKLTSPVYDPVSGNVFVGDTAGYFYAVGTGNNETIAGSVTTSAHLGDAIIDGPLVDPSAGMAYVFVTTSSGNNTVYQFPTNLTDFASGTGKGSVAVGAGATGYYLYAGDFDNVYYQSPDHTGNLYVVGNTGGTTLETPTGATLYRIPISSNSMGTPVPGATLTGSSAPPWPSPLTEFCNNSGSACSTDGTNTISGKDYLFFSVNQGAVGTCADTSGNGCVLSYNITTPSSPTISADLNVTNVGSLGCWATGGIVIDNSDSAGSGAQVYFLGLNGATAGGAGGATSSGCATGTGTIQAWQASQAALK